jgi:regulator of protease activity HflC (stomatin/prohibitin superfamily)
LKTFHETPIHLRTSEENEQALELRERIQKNREDHRHHALDAIVIGLTSQSMIQKLNQVAGESNVRVNRMRDGSLSIDTRLNPPIPHSELKQKVQQSLDSVLVSFRKDERLASWRKNPYRWVKKELKDRLANSQSVLAPRGALHKESIFGSIVDPTYKDEVKVIRKQLSDLKDLKQIEKVVDTTIRKLLLDRFSDTKKFEFDKENNHYNLFLPVKADPTKRVPILSVRLRQVLPPSVEKKLLEFREMEELDDIIDPKIRLKLIEAWPFRQSADRSHFNVFKDEDRKKPILTAKVRIKPTLKETIEDTIEEENDVWIPNLRGLPGKVFTLGIKHGTLMQNCVGGVFALGNL